MKKRGIGCVHGVCVRECAYVCVHVGRCACMCVCVYEREILCECVRVREIVPKRERDCVRV